MIATVKFGGVYIAPFMRLDEPVEDFLFGASRDDRETRKLAVIFSSESFGDIARCGGRGICKVVAKSEISSNRRLLAKPVSQLAQLNCQLPGD